MKDFTKALLVLMAIVLLSSSCKDHSKAPLLAYKNCNIVDPEKGSTLYKQIIYVKNGIITGIQDTQKIDLIQADSIIDLKGAYVLPGLWDMHAHLEFFMQDSLASINEILARNVSAGIFYIRDLGSSLATIDKINELRSNKEEAYPRIYQAGPSIIGKNSPVGSLPFQIKISDKDSIEYIIDSLINNDVKLIKLYDFLSKEDYLRAVAYAKEKGIKTAGHYPSSLSYQEFIESNLNSLEHIPRIFLAQHAENGIDQLNQAFSLWWRQGYPAYFEGYLKVLRSIDYDLLDNTVSQLKGKLYLSPTLVLEDYDFPFYPSTIPNKIKLNQAFDCQSHKDKINQLSEEQKSEYNQHLEKIVKVFAKYNITPLAGTDFPVMCYTTESSLYEEIKLLHRFGYSKEEALRAATVNPAKYFEIEHYGIVPNAPAKFMVLKKNPLEDLNNLYSIEQVVAW